MNTLKYELHKIDMVKVILKISMAMMEGFGIVALVCGVCGVRIF